MGVYDELKRMSDGEIVKRSDEIEILLQRKRKSEVSIDEERKALEEYFVEYMKKSIHTEKDKEEHAKKQARYDELEKIKREVKKDEEVEVEEEYKGLSVQELEKEAQRIRVYIKIKDILAEAESKVSSINEEKNKLISDARKELADAEEAAKKMAELDSKIRELEEYFEEYMKKSTHTEKEKEEYAKKQAEYDIISEEKRDVPSLSVEAAKAKLNKVILTTPELKTAKKLGNAIEFMNDEKNWDTIEGMSEQELKNMIAEKEKEGKTNNGAGKDYTSIFKPIRNLIRRQENAEPEEPTTGEPEEPTTGEPKEGFFKKLANRIKDSKVGKAIAGFVGNIKGKRQARLAEKNATQEGIILVKTPRTAREERAEFAKQYSLANGKFEDIRSGSSIILPNEIEVNPDAHIVLPENVQVESSKDDAR